MLEWKRFLEPGIEHAVGKHVVRNGRAGVTSPGSEAQVLPNAIHNDAIIIAAVLAKPGPESPRIAVTGQAGTERVHSQIELGCSRRRAANSVRDYSGRIIEHDDVDFVPTTREPATEPEDRRRHAANARIERVHQLQNLQSAKQRNLPSAGNICSRAKAILSAAPERHHKADRYR